MFLSPLLVTRSFGEEVWRLTANEVTFFAGSILGGLLMTAWGGFENRFRTIGMSCLLFAVMFIGMGLARDFTLYLVFMFLAGIPMPFWSASTTTLLQEIVAPDLQGRVFGVQALITNTLLPAGMVFFGPLADVVSIETLLVATSVLMAAPGLWIFFHRRPVKALPAPAVGVYEWHGPASQPGD